MIETKPVEKVPAPVIKPSKTLTKVETEQKVAKSQNVPNSAQQPKPTLKKPQPPKAVFTKVEVNAPKVQTKVNVVTKVDPSQIFSSSVDVHPEFANNIGEPEYDFLSRQPSEYIEETYQIRNLKPSKFLLKPRASTSPPKPKSTPSDLHPTGLVTKMGGTVVKDGATTVHETSVIGTFISGKYAQVLQSTSHIYNPKNSPKIQPTSSLRILKTAAPVLNKSPKVALDPTPANSLHDETLNLPLEALFSSAQTSNLVRPSRRPAVSGPTFKNRFNKGRSSNGLGQYDTKEQEYDESENDDNLSTTHVQYASVQPSYKKGNKNRPAGSRSFKYVLSNSSKY